MKVNKEFEKLYQAIIKQREKENQSNRSLNPSLKYVSNEGGGYQMFNRNNVASSSVVSETITISSQHSAMSTYSPESKTITIKSTKSEQRSTTLCQGEDILSVQEELHQESSCKFSAPSCVTLIADESVCQEDPVSDSVSQYTYEATDGYQSGESNMSDVRRLCEDCKTLYNKLRKRKRPAVIKVPRIPDLRSWHSKCWMFVNSTSARGSGKTLKRSLGSAIKRLKSLQISKCSPPAGIHPTCCRSHLFLKRNIRLCKEEQKRSIFEDQAKKKRKQPNSGRKSKRPKQSVPSNRAEETVPLIGKKARKIYSFVLDSSQEEDADPEMKRSKLEIKNRGRKPLLRDTEAHSNSGRTTRSTRKSSH